MTVLDTNVLSELMRSAPSAQVMDWFAGQSREELFTTAIAQAEILQGIELFSKARQMAAIACSHAAALATRNTSDFEGCGVTVVNPWNPK